MINNRVMRYKQNRLTDWTTGLTGLVVLFAVVIALANAVGDCFSSETYQLKQCKVVFSVMSGRPAEQNNTLPYWADYQKLLGCPLSFNEFKKVYDG